MESNISLSPLIQKKEIFFNTPKVRNKKKSLEFISVDAVQCKFFAWFTRSLWFTQSYFTCSELSLTLKLWRTMWPARECFWLWNSINKSNSITELTLKSSNHIFWIIQQLRRRAKWFSAQLVADCGFFCSVRNFLFHLENLKIGIFGA